MNENILNKSLVEKNIEQINYYAEEENQTLNKIYEKLQMCADNYSTSNKALFLEKIANKDFVVSKIASKRAIYSKVLTNAIARYDRVSGETINRFDGDIYEGR